jgi:biofilm PGA synthesis N-glycosyltransferase PgaC
LGGHGTDGKSVTDEFPVELGCDEVSGIVDDGNESKVSISEDLVNTSYVIITPVRNEAEFIENTLVSVCRQTIKPAEWVIVNDGSNDATPEIVTRYAAQYPWIKLVDRDDRGARQRGKGVVEAFYAGYDTLVEQNYGFIVKLDGDLSFEPPYFECLLREFASIPRLGIAGGGVYERLDGRNWVLQTTKDHVRGPTKVYRRACFEAIGGLVPALGWDGMDEWQARAMGWQVQSFLNLKVFHYRFTGAATGPLKSRIEQGYGAHYMGYHPLYTVARGIRYIFTWPYLIGGITLVAAYFAAWLLGREQFPDRSLINHIRRTQLKQLVGLLAGKPVHEK